MGGITLSLDGCNALVTGASSGLGTFLAEALDAAGASVAVHYHGNKSGAEELADRLSNPSVVLQADLGNLEDVRLLFSNAIQALGPLDVLVNCAAAESQNVSDLANISSDLWSSTMTTNVDAPMVLTQLFAAQIALAEKGSGSIINITSIEGSRPAPGHSHYSTSKAALEMFTRTSALEFGPLSIRVNAIAPGLINRAGIEEGWPEGVAAWKEAAPLGRLVDPNDIASTCVFLASPLSSSISGTILTVDCGLSIKPGW
ncbi:MAG: SDR family NAD(P)-dependent oxidoreductase [Proteobacteria bacterium]|nr:SDR family NAD(P)-dependent oxidoreductase [Pseudomonadota bacterium]